MRLWGNDYNRMELAGAFGDLGTLIPFVVGYITLNNVDPLGILVAFGLFKIFSGLYFRTPVPVQPMKAIGGMAIAHPGVITHGMIWGSGIFTGFFWLLMGATGAITWIEKITTKPVVQGIMLGLGLGFLTEGIRMMQGAPFFALGGVVITLILLNSRHFPAMLMLLAYGVIVAFIQKPPLWRDLAHITIGFRLPELTFARSSLKELIEGSLILGVPQVPLTLGNAIIGTVAENNEYFPDRRISAKAVALDHGFMNLMSTFVGGIPLCHGAGGMAGHVRFGARTGGSLVIMGIIVLFTGLFLSESVSLLFQCFPRPILGVILAFAGVELALVIKDAKLDNKTLFVILVTAGVAMWNMGAAYLSGLLLDYCLRHRWVKL